MRNHNIAVLAFAFVALSCDEPIQPPPPPDEPPKPEVISVSISPTDTTVDIADPAILFTITVEVRNSTSSKDKEVACSSPGTSTTVLTTSYYLYDHPATPGKYTVTCRSVVDSTKSATATVTVKKYDLIAFVRSVYQSSTNWTEHIFVMNADGSRQRQLTSNARQDLTPAWSPDGKTIAFYRNDGWNVCSNGVSTIFTVRVDGSGLTNITRCRVGGQDPSFSPDGKKLVFQYHDAGDSPKEVGIGIIGLDGDGFKKLTAIVCSGGCSPDGSPDWSPDGKKIAFQSSRDGDWEVYVMNPDGSELINVSRNHAAHDFQPRWSPDGSKLAFTSRRDGIPQIYVMNADGTGAVKVTSDPMGAADPTWSPDGKRIAYTGGWTNSEMMDIWVVNADGSNPTNVTKSPSTPERWPAWRP